MATGLPAPGRSPLVVDRILEVADRQDAWSNSGTPGRALMSVASSTRASGRRRATTMWSAPVASASSSTIASRIASGETDRDRPDRMRANDSASARRPVSSAATAWRWRIAGDADDEQEGDDDPVDRRDGVGREAQRRRSGRG